MNNEKLNTSQGNDEQNNQIDSVAALYQEFCPILIAFHENYSENPQPHLHVTYVKRPIKSSI